MARRHGETAAWPAQRLSQRIREFLSELPGAIGGDESAVHDMRVAGRRLRVALSVLPVRPQGRPARVRTQLKRLISAAGRGRDADVCLNLLRRLLPARGAPVGARRLRRRLESARSRHRRQMADAMLDQPIARLRANLKTIAGKRADDLDPVSERLRRQTAATAEEILTLVATLGTQFDADELHLMRRRVRRLRYLTELVVSWKGSGEDLPPLLRELQEDLGALHDSWVLAGWLAREEEPGPRTTPEIVAEAKRLRALCLGLCREHHTAFLGRNPAEIVRAVTTLTGVEESAWTS